MVKSGSVDMILSQAVMEHVEHLEQTYEAMRHWLKPGGLASHAIDFKSHGTAEQSATDYDYVVSHVGECSRRLFNLGDPTDPYISAVAGTGPATGLIRCGSMPCSLAQFFIASERPPGM